jgi:hypothetical protein
LIVRAGVLAPGGAVGAQHTKVAVPELDVRVGGRAGHHAFGATPSHFSPL